MRFTEQWKSFNAPCVRSGIAPCVPTIAPGIGCSTRTRPSGERSDNGGIAPIVILLPRRRAPPLSHEIR